MKTTLAVLAVVLIGLLLSRVERGATGDQERLAQLSATWKQIWSMKERRASDEEWHAFSQDVSAWLGPTVRALEDEICRDPVDEGSYWFDSRPEMAERRRNLLRFGRGLQYILQDPSSRRDAAFGGLNQMHAHLTAERSVTRKPAGRVDALAAGLLELDLVVICAVAVWSWRRIQKAR